MKSNLTFSQKFSVLFWNLAIFYFLFFHRDGPLVVIACGRDTVSIASSIRRLASENVFVVQVCYKILHGLLCYLKTL